MLCCTVPSAEVLALTSELQQLGGGDVAVGRAWAGAVVAAAAAAAAAAADQLDASASDWASLAAALDAKLQPWLQRGFDAAVMLLGGGAMSAASIATAACAGTLGSGGRVGVSWRLLSGGVVRDPWGRRQQLPGAGSSRRPGGASLPASRLAARDAAAAAGEDAAEPCTLLARTAAELSQLLDVAQAQLQAAAGAAADTPAAELQPAPALLLHLSLAAADERPSAALHLLHVPAPQGAAAEQQQEALLRLLREAADLHHRRREGEHLLASAKLSPLNQLAAPLLAGNARLFLAADLQGKGGGGSSSSSSGIQQGIPPLLAAVRHMQAACTKGRATLHPTKAGSASSSPDSWLPAQQFLEQLEQRRLAEQQRKAEAAVLAAAEADRRARLHQAAKERQQAVQTQPAPAASTQQQQQDHRQQLQQQRQQRPPEAAAAGQGGPGYRPSPYGSPAKPGSPAAAQHPQPPSKPAAEEAASAAAQPEEPVAQAAAAADLPRKLAEPPLSSSTGSLQQLRQQFQSLYSLALGQGAASPPAHPVVSRPAAPAQRVPAEPAKPPAAEHHTIAADVAAADDIAVHVAALRMQAAVEARRALQTEQQLLGAQPTAAADFTCAGRYGGQRSSSSEGASTASGSRPGSGGGLAQQLQNELLLLQHQAAQAGAQAAGAAGETVGATEPGFSPQAASFADFSVADLASLGDLEGHTPSLAALYGRSASCGGSLLGGLRSQRSSPSNEGQAQPAAAAGAGEQHGEWQGMGATPQSRPAAPAASPLLFLSPSVAAAAQSDVFKSANLPLWSSLPAGNGDRRSPAAGSDGIDQPAGPGMSSSRSSWRDDRSSAAGASRPSSRPQSAGSSRQQQQRQESGGPAGSYAAAWRRQTPSARPSAAASPASNARSSQQPPCLPPARTLQAAASNSELAAVPSAGAAVSLRQPSEAAQSELVPAELASAEVAGLLEELQREQRISSALLQQLHEVQRQLEEAAAMAAAAAAAQQPPAPGVQDPDDFNGLLAALQLERQQCAALRQQLELQAQQAEEAQLALEARLHTQQRQLLVAAARCRAWEQGTPLASLFRRYEADLQRLAAERGQLEEESCQLARLLAAADLERLAAAAARLPEDPAAVCREHQRKLAQAQAQVRKLQEEHAALSKRLQGAERRDRLAELCRRQAESGAKAAAELRQQLAARERQLEAQSLAAAEAAGEAERLRQQLDERDRELGRTLADRAELEDTVDSLRKQVAVLKGQLSRDRVLRSMQA